MSSETRASTEIEKKLTSRHLIFRTVDIIEDDPVSKSVEFFYAFDKLIKKMQWNVEFLKKIAFI
jgi:hypothetical protein